MGIEDLAVWYQKKIGTYDKQQWEKTVELKILHGNFTNVRTKLAKPKTEFIDLDLIRGSSFPKAKPKHSSSVVARLAIQRYLFFPFYGRWWIRQTSANIFRLFLVLYIFQLLKIILYIWHWNDIPLEPSEKYEAPSPGSEIILPMVIMFILSLIHSTIASTNQEPERRTPHARAHIKRQRIYSSNGLRIKHTKVLSEENRKINEVNYSKKKLVRSYTRRVKLQQTQNKKRTCDEGFESFNGNGSSENGDESKENTEKTQEVTEKSPDKNTKENLQVENKNTSNNLKISSDEHESDTESDDGLVIRRRNITKPCISKEETETDSDTQVTFKSVASLPSRRGSHVPKCEESSCFESDGNEEEPNNVESSPLTNESLASASEWIGITTNSEECSYSSESIDSDSQEENNNDQTVWDNDFGPTTILSPSCAPSDLVSCTIWENREMKKADLSVLDISSSIIGRVESMPDTMDYFYFGIFVSLVLSVVPIIIRICEKIVNEEENLSMMDMSVLIVGKLSNSILLLINVAFGSILWHRVVMVIALIERFILAMLFFFQLAVAERTFKQRFLYAKLFSHLTSSRKARKSDLPHFRLNKVRNIKTWLSVRSYLKKRGPQRSVDVIVSAAFIITLLLICFVSIELVKNSAVLNSQYTAEALIWGLCLGLYLLRFMTLGTKINSKYRNLSVLMTEQINLYLQIEQKPHKKEELMVANSVLKLATDLLKELESPFKISGLSANPYLYTITKLIILSALSGVFSEMLGFKLKLHKLSIK